MEEKDFVKNTADEEQVKEAGRRVDRRRTRELNDLRSVLATKEGRRFFWRILSYCGTFKSIWETSARIHYNAGQQDIGHFLFGELHEADENAYSIMMKEAKEGDY